MAKKATLSAALESYLDRTAIRTFTCQELANAVAGDVGHQPSLMAVSRIMGARAGWEKGRVAGKVIFSRSA